MSSSPNLMPESIRNNVQMNTDSAAVVEDALKRSGGDAKSAFYLLAKEKGIDPDSFLKQFGSENDMKAAAMKVLNQNPQMKRLMSLFSLIK